MDVSLPSTRREVFPLTFEIPILDFVIYAERVQVLGHPDADRVRR